MSLEEMGGDTYPDLRRLWVCFVDDGGYNGEAVEATLQSKVEIGVVAGRCRGDCAILHGDLG